MHIVSTKTNWFLWIAGVMSVIAVGLHEIAGSPAVLPPLFTTELPAAVIWLHHFSWHTGSVAMTVMAVLFIYPALRPGHAPMAIIATCMALAYAVLGVGHTIASDGALRGTPAPYLFTTIGVIGALGARAARAAST